MMRHKKTSRPHFSCWPIRIAVILGCLTMLYAYMLSGTYAKFSSIFVGTDSARVAKFDVQVSALNDQTVLIDFFDEDVSGAFKVTVTNNSEVSIRYKVEVKFLQSLPEFLSLEIDGKSNNMTANENRTVFTFDGFSFGVTGTLTREHIIAIKTDSSSKPVTPDQFIQDNVSVIVKAEQID